MSPSTTIQHNTPTCRGKPSAADNGGSEVSPDFKNITRTHAEKGQVDLSSQAERRAPWRRGLRAYSNYGNPSRTYAEEGQAEHSGQAECSGKGESGVSSDYETTKHVLAQKKAKRSGQAERCGNGRSRVFPDYNNSTRTYAEEGQAERSGKAERSG